MNAPIRFRRTGATPVSLTVNGRAIEAEVEPRAHLADFLREDLNLTGTHLGCEHGVCGACTVSLDGEPARACLTFAATCGGASVVTIEGFDDDALMEKLRAAFNREHALQCGFCTPGMLIAARDLALRLPEPDERRIRVALAGNLCRCTGYAGIVNAIRSVIAERRARGIAPATGDRGLGPVGAHLSPPPCGEGSGVGVVQNEAKRAKPLDAELQRSVRNHPHPYPPRKGEGAEASRSDIPTDFVPAHTLDQRFSVAFPPEKVFALFGDVRAVAECLPGAFVDATPSPVRVEGGIRVGLGPITAAFRGAASVTRDEAARSGRILGAGADGRSGAQGEIRYRVEPGAAPGSSDVVMQIGHTLKGPLAQFGRPGLVRDIAGRLTAEFAKNLEARLSGAPVQGGAQPQAAGLNPFRLVAGLIGDWLKRLRPGASSR